MESVCSITISQSVGQNGKVVESSFKPVQVFFSVTKKSSIRGMHFYKSDHITEGVSQENLSESDKLISPARFTKSFIILSGEIFMAAIDLRFGSESFGTVKTLKLGVYDQVSLPKMVATGFQVTSNEATVLYFLDCMHNPQIDMSINPTTCAIKWPLPIGEISNRDKGAMTLEEYVSNNK